MSTGMFPQEFIIRFAEPTKISAVTMDSYNGMEAVILSYTALDYQGKMFEKSSKVLELLALSLLLSVLNFYIIIIIIVILQLDHN